MNTDLQNGVIIAGIESGSPAENSGLRIHDIVTGINGYPVKSSIEMRNRIGLLNIGDRVTINAHRGDQKITLTAEIGGERHTGSIAGDKLDKRLAGAIMANIPAGSNLVNQGIFIAEVERGSPASGYGLEKGDIIVSVNRKRIRSVKDIQTVMRPQPRQILINVQRGQSAFFLLIR